MSKVCAPVAGRCCCLKCYAVALLHLLLCFDVSAPTVMLWCCRFDCYAFHEEQA